MNMKEYERKLDNMTYEELCQESIRLAQQVAMRVRLAIILSVTAVLLTAGAVIWSFVWG